MATSYLPSIVISLILVILAQGIHGYGHIYIENQTYFLETSRGLTYRQYTSYMFVIDEVRDLWRHANEGLNQSIPCLITRYEEQMSVAAIQMICNRYPTDVDIANIIDAVNNIIHNQTIMLYRKEATEGESYSCWCGQIQLNLTLNHTVLNSHVADQIYDTCDCFLKTIFHHSSVRTYTKALLTWHTFYS